MKARESWLTPVWRSPFPKKYSNKYLPKLYLLTHVFSEIPEHYFVFFVFVFFFFHVKSRSNRLGMCRQKDRVNVCVYAKLLHLCLSLCDPMDCSPPGSSVQGSLQARILQWVAIPSSRGSSRPRDQAHISYDFCTGRRVLYH